MRLQRRSYKILVLLLSLSCSKCLFAVLKQNTGISLSQVELIVTVEFLKVEQQNEFLKSGNGNNNAPSSHESSELTVDVFGRNRLGEEGSNSTRVFWTTPSPLGHEWVVNYISQTLVELRAQ